MADQEEDVPMPDPTSAQLAAKQGRGVQMALYESYMKGEKVDFKNHQNISHMEVYNPAVFAKPKSSKLKFTDKYKFFDAVERGDIDEVVEMINAGMDPNRKNDDGSTALHLACINNNLKLASTMLQNGADANIQDCDWWTPLHAAAACGMWRLTNLLLSHGADATQVNSDGELAVDIAEGDRTKTILQEEMTRLGVDADKKLELLKAPEAKLQARIKELVAAREKLDTLDETGHALLHIAASNGWLECMELLLKAGADVDVIDREDGNTPLHLAVMFMQYQAVEMLGKHKATLGSHNRYREAPHILTEDATMLKLLEVLHSKQIPADFIAALPRNNTLHSAAKRRSTASKQDLTKMDQVAEHKKLDTTFHGMASGPIATGPRPKLAATPAPAPAAAPSAIVPSVAPVYNTPTPSEAKPSDLYSKPKSKEKISAAEIQRDADEKGRDDVQPTHPKIVAKETLKTRKASAAALAIAMGNAPQEKGCCLIL